MNHSFYLELGGGESTGYALDVWDGYEITLDMLAPGSPWTFELWRVEGTRNVWSELVRRAVLGERVTLAIDGLVLLDGKIRTASSRANRSGAKLAISGTDLAGAAMHAHADPTRTFAGLSLQTALERLFEPLSIPVEIGDGVDPSGAVRGLRPPRRPARRRSRRRTVVDRFRPRVGETVWQCADALCRKAGYLLWTAPGSTPDRLTLRVDSPRLTGPERFTFLRELAADGTVTQRSNILEGANDRSLDGVPTDVTVFADSPRGDATAARLARRVENDRIGGPGFSFIVPAQPHYLLSSRARSVAEAQREATRVIGDANRTLDVYRCVVQGHGQESNGQMHLYVPNELARVRDDLLGREMDGLLTRVVLKGARAGGQTSELTIVPRGAIKVSPAPE
jgi:prophage tail gpP-like protein